MSPWIEPECLKTNKLQTAEDEAKTTSLAFSLALFLGNRNNSGLEEETSQKQML